MNDDVLSLTLDGTVTLVTGASGGIGSSICRAVAAAGGRVVGSDIGEAPADLSVDAWFQHDVTSADGWTHLINEIRNRFGRLDCLINNAGMCAVEAIADTSLERWRRMFSVNVESIFLSLQASAQLLNESGKRRPGGASVVNTSSIVGLKGSAFGAAYSSSKGAVTLLTKSAAREFAALGYPIRVNSVHPGPVDTSMMNLVFAGLSKVRPQTSQEALKAGIGTSIPLGRMARAAEIAGGVVFLCSNAASYMTGAELVIDGGVSA